MIPDPLSAVLADRYVLERELGAGGMATVYLAEDVRHHRKVAVKVLHPELAATLGPERFFREIRTTARALVPSAEFGVGLYGIRNQSARQTRDATTDAPCRS